MTKPLVTIQIPTYNQKAYIKQALDSALAQTYENLQIIVADDCSPAYDVFEYLSEYLTNPKVFIFRHPKNVGRVANYRYCLYELVEGDWFINLDGDDYFNNNTFVENAVEAISAIDSKYTISLFHAGAITRKIPSLKIFYEDLGAGKFLLSGYDYISKIDNGIGFTHASMCFNVKIARSVDFYCINALDADYFSYLKLLKEGFFIAWDQKVYVWRRHDNQATDTLSFDECVVKFDEIKDLKKHFEIVPKDVKRVLFDKTNFDITIQLYTNFFREKFSWRKSLFLLSKLKFTKEYLYALGSIIKRSYFVSNKSNQ